jgi:hypothetical protein
MKLNGAAAVETLRFRQINLLTIDLMILTVVFLLLKLNGEL